MSATEITEPLFRPVKKRKFLRKRAEEQPETPSEPTSLEPTPSSTGQAGSAVDAGAASLENADRDEDEAGLLPELIRLRKAQRSRKGGIEFSADPKAAVGTTEPSSGALTTQDLVDQRLQAISDRFVANTGQKVDVDKHMMAYIESEMARRHHNNQDAESSSAGQIAAGASNATSEPKFPQRQPASLGKLHEIDLGPDSKLRNIERTEAATRKLAGDGVFAEQDAEDATVKNVRLGKDGKPWRGRKRRNSEDLKRDQLVEEILRESKLDVYDEPEEGPQNDDQAADDRIADQFRRDFLDAIQSRRRGAKTKNTKAAKTDAPRGPKLGGSRSARAAMRERQEKSGQK